MQITPRQIVVGNEKIRINDQEYTLAPLPLIRLKEISPIMNGGDPMNDEGYAVALVSAIYYGLLRNYEGISREMVEENLDLTTFQEWIGAFMRANGFKEKTTGEDQASQ